MRLQPVLLALLLAGCSVPSKDDPPPDPLIALEDTGVTTEPIEPASTATPSPADEVPAPMPQPDASASASPPPRPNIVIRAWAGANLTPAERDAQCVQACTRPCGPGVCERVNVTVPVERAGERLEIALRWENGDGTFDVRLEDTGGRILAQGPTKPVRVSAGRVGDSVALASAAAGEYVAVVTKLAGETPSGYLGAARLVPHPQGSLDLLPDFVTLAPSDLRIESPLWMNDTQGRTVASATALGGARGCSPLEQAANQATRCLRFSNAVGNVGVGPVDIRLAPDAGAGAFAGNGHFAQVVHKADGTSRVAPAGPAEFHAAHGHWHNAASNGYAVYRYDEATGARGEPLGAGKKGGICIVDIGIVDLAVPVIAEPWEAEAFPGSGCLVPQSAEGWSMRLQAGWYDMYPWSLEDQYVELGPAPDGTYLLCATVNQLGTLVESDTTNNEGCTPFRLTGNAVEELAPRAFHAWEEA